jgi:hypothetical protein
LPPGVADVAVKYASSNGFEANISVVPGLLFGYRFLDNGVYLSTGGGYVIGANGNGLGAYTAFGYISGSGAGLHFNAEYTQALGVVSKVGWIAPGAARIGCLWEF